MSVMVYGPVEQTVKTWLQSTSVAPLVQRGPGAYSIYLSMPPAAPIPALLISLVGGGPEASADLPETRYRLQFDCLGTTRDQASLIARTLMGELNALGVYNAGLVIDGVYLANASVLSMLWLPDPDSDKPRYVVDATVTTVL